MAGWQNQWPPGRRFPPSFFACPSHFSCTQNPLFLPFQTPATQARTSQKEFQILAFLHVTGWKINLIRYIFNASCPPINLERWIEIREVMITAYKLNIVIWWCLLEIIIRWSNCVNCHLTIIYNMHIVLTVTLTVIKLKFKLFFYQLWMHTQLGVVHAKPLSVPLRE